MFVELAFDAHFLCNGRIAVAVSLPNS